MMSLSENRFSMLQSWKISLTNMPDSIITNSVKNWPCKIENRIVMDILSKPVGVQKKHNKKSLKSTCVSYHNIKHDCFSRNGLMGDDSMILRFTVETCLNYIGVLPGFSATKVLIGKPALSILSWYRFNEWVDPPLRRYLNT